MGKRVALCPLFVSSETWSKSMTIIEVDSHGRERIRTQMASYPGVAPVSCQELIVQEEVSQ